MSSMFTTAAILGWSKLLRVSEFTSKASTFIPKRELSRADIRFVFETTSDYPTYVEATIKWHKTVATAGVLVKRTYASLGGRLCMVASLLHLLDTTPCPPDSAATTPLFH